MKNRIFSLDEKRDQWEDACKQAQAQFESIREMVEALDGCEATARAEGWEPYMDKFGVACWRDSRDGATFAGTAAALCEYQNLVPSSEAQEDAQRVIHEDALSVEVRSDWHSPGQRDADTKPAEYRILLCTGGPAVQITGQLSEHGEPESARLEMQDWFLPWTEYRPLDAAPGAVAAGHLDPKAEEILLAYARQFYFGGQ